MSAIEGCMSRNVGGPKGAASEGPSARGEMDSGGGPPSPHHPRGPLADDAPTARPDVCLVPSSTRRAPEREAGAEPGRVEVLAERDAAGRRLRGGAGRDPAEEQEWSPVSVLRLRDAPNAGRHRVLERQGSADVAQ